MSLLNKYAKKFQEKKEKARITVSVVGFTNVGKSSLVNFLKGKNLAATNSNPFMTKRNLEVSISAQIILVDTPAVMIMSNEDNEPVTAA
jgi:ribosome biogenesis GTPase A